MKHWLAKNVALARQWMQSNPKPAMGIAGGVFALSLVLLPWMLLGGGDSLRPVDAEYWYDLGKNELFVMPVDQITGLPPLPAPSGGHAVRAYVFACGDCSDASKRIVGLLETYSDEAKQLEAKIAQIRSSGEAVPGDLMAQFESGHVIRGIEGDWIAAQSDAGLKLGEAARAAHGRCPPDVAIISCMP